ncbi:MAG: hypothetical protein ACRC92_25920 [Peptostreptococcaceae bacterium]
MKELELQYYMQIGTVVQDEVLDRLVSKMNKDADNFEKGIVTIDDKPVDPLASFTCGYRNFVLGELNLQPQHIKEQWVSASIGESEYTVAIELPHNKETIQEEEVAPVPSNFDWEQVDVYSYLVPVDLAFDNDNDAVGFINELIGTPLHTFDRYVPNNTIEFGLQHSSVDFWIETPTSAGVEGMIKDAIYSKTRDEKDIGFKLLTHRGLDYITVDKNKNIDID